MTLFVGHLTEKIKDATLRKLFEPYGTITNIDRKGTYAFIEYEPQADTDRAVRDLHKSALLGTTLRVELSNRQRGGTGPPPGDLSETCYNCQQIGHIAKNCPLPAQPAQVQHWQRTLAPHRRNPLYSQYELEAGPSLHVRATMQQSRPAKREGFLDRNPQKIRLVEHGSQRLRMNPYENLTSGDGGPLHWSKGKGRAGFSATHEPLYPSPRPLENLPRSQRVVADPRVPNQAASPPEITDRMFEELYASGMQSVLSSGIMKMAGGPAQTPDTYPESLSPGRSVAESTDVDSLDTLTSSYLPQFSDTSSAQNAPAAVHPSVPAPGTQTIEYPYLPPGTLVYLPAVTVLPANRPQSPAQSRTPRPLSPKHPLSLPSLQPRPPPPPRFLTRLPHSKATPWELGPLALAPQASTARLNSAITRPPPPPPPFAFSRSFDMPHKMAPTNQHHIPSQHTKEHTAAYNPGKNDISTDEVGGEAAAKYCQCMHTHKPPQQKHVRFAHAHTVITSNNADAGETGSEASHSSKATDNPCTGDSGNLK